ncbi:MAG TPA: helix-turn-helix domain-containing protein [Acidobacteriaceae bacterium]|nr:helix-turn-helix domain-containing protein [Acidobacteriaceae bacterium]
MEAIKREAIEELDRMGFAALRKARKRTQVELARKLGVNQASVSGMENNSDLLLSTLGRYVHALGGEVRIQAVFPEAIFELTPLSCDAPKKRVRGPAAKQTRSKRTPPLKKTGLRRSAA